MLQLDALWSVLQDPDPFAGVSAMYKNKLDEAMAQKLEEACPELELEILLPGI